MTMNALHPSQGITLTSVSDITDTNAVAALAAECNTVMTLGSKLHAPMHTYRVDVNATGRGTMAFDLGVSGAAVISHYKDGVYTRQIVDVVNGQATGRFTGFSPLFITAYEGVSANQLRATGIVENEPGSVSVKNAPKSPNTGVESNVLLLIALLSLGAYMGLSLYKTNRI